MKSIAAWVVPSPKLSPTKSPAALNRNQRERNEYAYLTVEENNGGFTLILQGVLKFYFSSVSIPPSFYFVVASGVHLG
jgi:hypothetical protein